MGEARERLPNRRGCTSFDLVACARSARERGGDAMNDTTTSEAPAEAALPILPPAPAVAAEVEAAPSEAAAPVSNAPTEKVDHAAPEGEAPAAAPELAFANGSTSELVVDHFIDSAESGDQSMNQIKAALP